MTNELTTLQAAMLKKIARSEFTQVNGAEPKTMEDTGTWADVVVEDAQDRGVARSLVNAGLIYHDHEGREAVIGLTQAGFDAYKALAQVAA